jgi:hypothetical protein
MSFQMQKVYCVDSLINLNSLISNCLDFECELNKITIEPKEDSIQINSPLTTHLSHGFKILKDSEFLIPFKFQISTGYSNSLGKFCIFWQDEKLKLFDVNLFNKYEFNFPDVNVKTFELSLDYDIPRVLTEKNETPLKIFIKNKTDEYKRVIFLIDTCSQLAMSGNVNKKLLLHPKETKSITLPLIPICYGKLKLPIFKVMEYPMASTNFENKIYSIYKIPEFLQVSESN